MALIGIVDPEHDEDRPGRLGGQGRGAPDRHQGASLSSSETRREHHGRAGDPGEEAVVSNDSQSDPRVVFGKKYAEAGVRSMAVLPLIVADEAVGVLALYAERDASSSTTRR